MTANRIATKISPDILDTIGKSFKFNHGKGLAEWLKNSLDNYLRLVETKEETIAGNWPVLINLIETKSQINGPNLAVLDFGGTTLSDIESFFLYWGDTSAATLGGRVTKASVTGGHGNGGKFYMREMWRNGSRFLTWKEGQSTSLIIDKAVRNTSGEWEFKEKKLGWESAIMKALPIKEGLQGGNWVVSLIRSEMPGIAKELDNHNRGLTIIVGRAAEQLFSSNDVVRGGRWISQKLVDLLVEAQQSRRPIRELNISLFINGEKRLPRISLEELPLDGELSPKPISMPRDLLKKFGIEDLHESTLLIKKSAQQLTGRYKPHNNISVNDKDGNPIAYYPIFELPIPGSSPNLSFVFGELTLAFPEVKKLIENDRERLIASPSTEEILNWVSREIWAYVADFEAKQRAREAVEELKTADVLNNALNVHARRFLRELEAQIMVDFIPDPNAGGDQGVGDFGENGRGAKREGAKKGGRGGSGEGGHTAVPGGERKARKSKFPEVLLSGHHPDPADPGGLSKSLSQRHPPIHQDDSDRRYNIWWINTGHPYSKAAIHKGGVKGHAFKNYHLFLFVQIVQIETLRMMQRRQAEMGVDVIENELNDISNKFLSELPVDLVNSLLA